MLVPLACGLVAAALVWLLQARARGGSATRARGYRELTFPQSLRIGVLVLVVFSFVIVYAAAQARPDQALTASIVSACFVVGSFYLVWCVFLTRVWWTRDGIGSRHVFGRERFLRWDDVEAGGYLAWCQVFYVRGAGTRIWYSPMHAGPRALHRYMARRLDPVRVPMMRLHDGPDHTEPGR
jgi:hypothetical protein